MVTVKSTSGSLSWHGDNLMLTDEPALVHLMDECGNLEMCSFEVGLSVIDRLDESAYRLISQTIPWVINQGRLHKADVAAWRTAMPRVAAWLAKHSETQFVVYAPSGALYWPPEVSLDDARTLVAERSGGRAMENWAIVPLPLAQPYGNAMVLRRRELPKGADLNDGAMF
jgi:hypothetical protein